MTSNADLTERTGCFRQGGYVILDIYLSASLLAGLHKKVEADFAEIFRDG